MLPPYCLHFASILPPCQPNVVPMLPPGPPMSPKFVPHVASMLPHCCPHAIPMSPHCRPHVVHMSSPYHPIVVPMSPSCRPHVVPVKLWLPLSNTVEIRDSTTSATASIPDCKLFSFQSLSRDICDLSVCAITEKPLPCGLDTSGVLVYSVLLILANLQMLLLFHWFLRRGHGCDCWCY